MNTFFFWKVSGALDTNWIGSAPRVRAFRSTLPSRFATQPTTSFLPLNETIFNYIPLSSGFK